MLLSINIKKLFHILLLALPLWGEVPTLNTINTFEPSQAKDFYIWNFLQTAIDAQKANELFDQIDNVTPKLFNTYAKKSDLQEIKEASRCLQFSTKELLKSSSSSCVALGLTPKKAADMSTMQRKRLAKKLQTSVPYVAQWLSLMDGKHTVGTRFFHHPDLYLYLFNRVGNSFRHKHFNTKLSKSFLNKLAQEEEFDKFVELTAIDRRLHQLNKSLIRFDSTRTQSTLARFYLAIIKIMHKKENEALIDLAFVSQNDFLQFERDKAIFWTYLITKDEALLDTLHRSTDLNIYTIFAAQKLHQDILGIYQPRFQTSNPLAVEENDPFVWSTLLLQNHDAQPQEACQLLQNFDYNNTQAIYSFFLERCANYALHPFITPYASATKELSLEKKALFYALGRQESRLIAGGLSSVFAQGLMQIMPFLSKAIAKQKRQTIAPDSMFDPYKNIEYAKFHLKYLHKKLNHPLFIAYAYNGGIGFLKRTLKRGYFKGRFSYDPFMSMELLPYPETRNYGKKVLANYIIYAQIFGETISIQNLFESLK